MKRLILITLTMGAACSVSAQTSPYAGSESRKIKALSQAEIDGYLRGDGMGLAKAAELNHYPGPKHVLDLSVQLELTSAQKEKTEEIFNAMKKAAVRLGKQLVDKEKELDRLFAENTGDKKRVEALLAEIGELQARLRYVHLRAHLEQKTILTQHQIALYDKLRGYRAGEHQHRSHKNGG